MGLLNLFDGLAEVAKLTIEAFEDANFGASTGDIFTVMYNPNTFSQNYRSVWIGETPQGGTADNQSYRRLQSDSVSFDFLFDGTGVSGVGGTSVDLNPKVGEVGYVQEQINAFMAITQGLNGSTHEPNFLQLSWGTFIFNGVMESATITYKLFHSSGAPLRATINAVFKQSVSRTEQAAQARLKSPDLTHFRIVKAGETLPLISKKVYGDSKYYLEIARVNNINNFRKLKAGQQLVLPPVEK
ncbi:MAG TPA: LysM peptidoglycan-binding domain-containing protein [Draconibacterium sp.]|nr:LysM peptidoglycan-binding domain-containing protein [Draconibacterium sp.]HRX13315.1 LysM peptidoglycan-binding domain-containing protein [Draconibacterium sp.]